jgi:hypothetical protein
VPKRRLQATNLRCVKSQTSDLRVYGARTHTAASSSDCTGQVEEVRDLGLNEGVL